MRTLQITLKGLRANKDLSQSEVAKMLGVDKVTVINWEKNRTSPNAVMLMKLCQIYDCKLDDILLPDKLAKSE